MTERFFKYVLHHDVEAFTAAGWIKNGGLVDTHHGFYSELMEWKGEGTPVVPRNEHATHERKGEIAP